MPRRARWYAGLAVTSSSKNAIDPDAAAWCPTMVRRSVVLPTPLRPSSDTDSPAATERSMPFSTRLLPYAAEIFVRLSNRRLLLPSEVHRNYLGIALDLFQAAFA